MFPVPSLRPLIGQKEDILAAALTLWANALTRISSYQQVRNLKDILAGAFALKVSAPARICPCPFCQAQLQLQLELRLALIS